MDHFDNPMPSCSWENPNWDLSNIEETLGTMEMTGATPPMDENISPLTDLELYGILTDNILDQEDNDDSELENDDIEEVVPVSEINTPEDSWLAGNPDFTTEIPFTKTSGLKEDLLNTPLSYFEALCNQELLHLLTSCTNEYGAREKALSQTTNSRSNAWKPLSCEELKIFLGLFFHMGFIKINRLSDYWKKDIYFSQNIFSRVLSRNRFLLILRMMCVSIGERTSYYKINKIIEFFNRRMIELYYPSKNIVIDESLMLWRGRLRFRQYMKGKKNKYGLKFYALADQLGVVLKLHLYGGASDVHIGGRNHVKKVVMFLMNSYLNVGHHLYVDNFYTSVDLVEELFSKNTYCTGTLRKQRKNNPITVIKTKLKKGELCIQHKNNICVVKWMDQREVLGISSKYNGCLETTQNRRGQTKLKPQIISHYNKNMHAIDRHDQMLMYYSCEHKSLRWYKKVIFHIMQIIMINSFFLYNKYSSRVISLYDFRLNIIKSILEPSMPPELQRPLGTKIHCLKRLDKDEKGKTKRRRCIHCWNTKKKRITSLVACENCPQQPGLCVECFRPYHKY